jgi:hypothetical protein
MKILFAVVFLAASLLTTSFFSFYLYSFLLITTLDPTHQTSFSLLQTTLAATLFLTVLDDGRGIKC